MTTLEELQELCLEIQALTKLDDIKWQKRFGNDEGLYGLIKAEREAYANQVAEEKVRKVAETLAERTTSLPTSLGDSDHIHIRVAKKVGKKAAFHGPIAQARYDGYRICAKDVLELLASLNKPQETRPQTNGDLVEDPATGITIFPKAAKPDSRPLPNSHGK